MQPAYIFFGITRMEIPYLLFRWLLFVTDGQVSDRDVCNFLVIMLWKQLLRSGCLTVSCVENLVTLTVSLSKKTALSRLATTRNRKLFGKGNTYMRNCRYASVRGANSCLNVIHCCLILVYTLPIPSNLFHCTSYIHNLCVSSLYVNLFVTLTLSFTYRFGDGGGSSGTMGGRPRMLLLGFT